MERKAIPKQHLTVADGKWSLIYQGLPLCAPTDRATAEKVALRYGFNAAQLPVWDGDAGAFLAAAGVQS